MVTTIMPRFPVIMPRNLSGRKFNSTPGDFIALRDKNMDNL